jgi:hypothetical protein
MAELWEENSKNFESEMPENTKKTFRQVEHSVAVLRNLFRIWQIVCIHVGFYLFSWRNYVFQNQIICVR